ncbi:LOW QUALITY PROTEIN: aspartate--tRNA ligase 2, cytoplasmic [Oryza brachyantha]|uniref:LOW QUALITY PROTEIN: aspartate--tRNA ligase 2, cytoplasmic n=1 Tax=Oryza brachyantha TaxID=4533 RepID=UPI001ADC0C0D|nr:LOW QUALITY PROTEIN: aspartate--tRNA ligase 2, cytoplasmic [Oryza brachyantha]
MSTGDESHGDPRPEEADAGYGDVTGGELFGAPGYGWADVAALGPGMAGAAVRVRGAAHAVRAVGRRVAFLVLRQGSSTAQCVVGDAATARFAAGLSRESVVDVAGVVSLPREPVRGTTQQGVEIQVKKLYCISRATPNLPISVDDAARSEEDVARAKAAGEQLVHVGQDKRLDYRVIDLRTPANQAIFRVQCEVENIFRKVLLSEGFVGIHTPKLLGGASEGGAAVFKLDYNGQPACLAQSPQLHKQTAICGGFERVFEVGPVFRAEDSNTHRHLCEFVGLDMEMAIKDHYSEVCDVVDRLFVAMFDHLNKNCAKELEAIHRQYPFKPLKYLPKTLRIDYDEGIRMLKEAGVHVEDMGDLKTEAERKLGELVQAKFDTDFYMLCRYPSAVRPFYTMPCSDDPRYSNSFDVFVRGEEIISGAQRVHVPEVLTKQAAARGVDVGSIAAYVESFGYGAPPHGGFGVGLERVVTLFCGLGNIRKASLFPRDPRRLTP